MNLNRANACWAKKRTHLIQKNEVIWSKKTNSFDPEQNNFVVQIKRSQFVVDKRIVDEVE